MPETTTIPKTVQVPTAALFETIGYLEHLADVIGALNGRQSTPLENSMNMAAQRLLEAAGLGRETVEGRVAAARERFTKRWASEIAAEMDGDGA
jgi:hypothetical protein